jgi:hypothetical protein
VAQQEAGQKGDGLPIDGTNLQQQQQQQPCCMVAAYAKHEQVAIQFHKLYKLHMCLASWHGHAAAAAGIKKQQALQLQAAEQRRQVTEKGNLSSVNVCCHSPETVLKPEALVVFCMICKGDVDPGTAHVLHDFVCVAGHPLICSCWS